MYFTSPKSRIALQVARKIAPCDRVFKDATLNTVFKCLQYYGFAEFNGMNFARIYYSILLQKMSIQFLSYGFSNIFLVSVNVKSHTAAFR